MRGERTNLIGQRFGRLTVLARADNAGAARRWDCRCDCGGSTVTRTNCLRSGNTQSCGCLYRERLEAHRATFHHLCDTAEYRAWTLMRSRCTNPKTPNYGRYGGRGITICPEWNDFPTFLRDMGPRHSPQHSIERNDNDGPYAPWNCRWATDHEQNRNKHTTRMFEHAGERLILNDWAVRAGINKSTLYYRLKRGMSLAEAMKRPMQKGRDHRPITAAEEC